MRPARPARRSGSPALGARGVRLVCKTPEEYKAWSQNLGHEKVLTTFTSYGVVGRARQAELIARIGREKEVDPLEAVMQRLAQLVAHR